MSRSLHGRGHIEPFIILPGRETTSRCVVDRSGSSSAYVPLRTEPSSATVGCNRAVLFLDYADRDFGSPSFHICNGAGCPRSLFP